ncbi:MAG: cellulase family glycosylhydrolase [Polyangiaceae bacterium]
MRSSLALCCAVFPSLATACVDGGAERPRPGAGVAAPFRDAGAPQSPPAEPQPPWLRLEPGARYFESNGVQAPLLLRNVSAPSVSAFTPLFRAAREAGTNVVRLQLTQGFGYDTLGITREGSVLASWAASWDAVLTDAEQQGLAVIVVFTLWGDWNDGTPALGWSHYDANPLSSARGGPASAPADLFADSETQRLWLGWLSSLVARWSSRSNVIAWEVFSELDLASGVSEASATSFVEKAHQTIRDIDPWRPAFASTSDLPLIMGRPWQALWNSPGNDIVSLHPYDPELDRVASERARSLWQSTSKPVLIGESGLDAAAPDGTTLTSAPRAAAGLTHAIWAELVSGAASARALYWEDGYAAYYPGTGLPLVSQRDELERVAAQWLAGKDFRGQAPVSVSGEPALFGGALVSTTRVSGWARNAELAPPEWYAAPLASARVQVWLPPESADADWTITLTRPDDGSTSELSASARGGLLGFDVAGPFESIAFDAVRGESLPPICGSPGADSCTGPIYALALDGVSLFANPECPELAVYLNVTECRSRRSLSLTSCPGNEVPAYSGPCIDLYVGDIGNDETGNGTYYDGAGTAFDLVVSEVEADLEGLNPQSIRTGVVRGSRSPSLGGGSSQSFELTFSACANPPTMCLL